MALYPLGDFITTMKDGLRRALRVQEQNKIGYSQFYFSRTGSLEAGQEEYLLNTQNPVAIDILEYATAQETGVHLRIRPYINGVLEPLMVMLDDGRNVQGLYPIKIKDHISSIFSINIYDKQNNKYKFSLKRSLYFPEGVAISVRNTSDSERQIGALVFGREFL